MNLTDYTAIGFYLFSFSDYDSVVLHIVHQYRHNVMNVVFKYNHRIQMR